MQSIPVRMAPPAKKTGEVTAAHAPRDFQDKTAKLVKYYNLRTTVFIECIIKKNIFMMILKRT